MVFSNWQAAELIGVGIVLGVVLCAGLWIWLFWPDAGDDGLLTIELERKKGGRR